MNCVAIILGCENIDLTVECVAMLRLHAPDVRILYVDNGTSIQEFTRLIARLEEFSGYVRVTRLSSNEGFSRGINHGLAVAHGMFGGTDILILNNDCFVGPGCVTRLSELAHQQGAITGPVTIDGGAESLQKLDVRQACQVPAMPQIQESYSRDRCWLIASAVAKSSTPPIRQGYIPFCCAYLTADAVRDVGPLPAGEAYRSGLHADTEWCRRAQGEGYEILLDTNAFAWHLGSATFKKLGLDYASELHRSRQQYESDGSDHAVAAMLLCDRKRYCGSQSLQAISQIYGLKKIYLNIETELSPSDFKAAYCELLCAKDESAVPVVMDVWRIHSEWMKRKPSHDQDQYYRLPRIVAGRNQACEWFWHQPEATHLLFIDSDVIPKPDGLQRLLSHKKPLCGGLVHGRGEHHNVRVLFDVLSQQDNLLECRWGSCGYMLIERKVLDVQRFRWGLSRAEAGQMRSEDPAFCEDAFLNGFGRYFIDEMVTADHIDNPQAPLVITDVAEF